MIVRSLELQVYGPLASGSFEFRRGMNLVYGGNESGKTTLMEAVAVALFGASDRQLPAGGDAETESCVAVHFEGSDGGVRLRRRLGSDHLSFHRSDDLYETLFEFEGGAAGEGWEEEQAELKGQLENLFGISSRELFSQIFCLRQDRSELYREGALPREVLALISGFDRTPAQRAIDSLTGDYLEITRYNPLGEDLGEDGPLELVLGRLKEIETTWHARQESLQQLSRVGREITELGVEIEHGESEAAKGGRFLERVRTDGFPAPSGEQDEVSRLSASLERIATLGQEAEQLHRERNDLALGENPDPEMPALMAAAEKERQNLIRLQGETASLREELIADSGPSWLFPVGAMVGFALLGALIVWKRSDLTLFAVFGAALLSALGWAVHFWLAGGKKAEIGGKKATMLALDEEREQSQLRLDELDERLKAAGLPISARELDKLRALFDRHREIGIRLREIDSALEVLGDPGQLEQQRQELLAQSELEGGGLQRPVVPEDFTEQDIEEAQERLEAFVAALDKKRQSFETLKETRLQLLEEVSDLGALESEGEELRRQEVQLLERKRVLAAARELLARTEEHCCQDQLQQFARKVQRHLGKMTGGRHKTLTIDGGGRLFLQGRHGQALPLSQSGQATIDAVGLALRLALIDRLFPDRPVPLLLDEPLVHLDRQRMEQTLKELETVATTHQVVIFTHHESLLKRAAKAGWNLLTLDETKKSPATEGGKRREHDRQLHLL